MKLVFNFAVDFSYQGMRTTAVVENIRNEDGLVNSDW
jgi:hypothetical protein